MRSKPNKFLTKEKSPTERSADQHLLTVQHFWKVTPSLTAAVHSNLAGIRVQVLALTKITLLTIGLLVGDLPVVKEELLVIRTKARVKKRAVARPNTLTGSGL